MKNFFKGISFSQIGAGALAAITSFLLSAKIGLAGSVIGVAIASIVSATSSQIYQNVLKESSKKIQAATPFGSSADDKSHDDGASEGRAGDGAKSGVSRTPRSRVAESTAVVPVEQTVADTGVISPATDVETWDASVSPRVIASDGTIEPGVKPTVTIGPDGAPHVKAPKVDSGVSGIHTVQRSKRIAIIVSVVSALMAVLITAGVITLVTRGKGTDSVVRDWTANTSINKRQSSQTPTPDRRSANTPSQEPSSTPGSTSTPSQSPTGSGSNAGNGSTGTSGDSNPTATSSPSSSSSDTSSSSSSPSSSSSDAPTSSSSPSAGSTDSAGQNNSTN